MSALELLGKADRGRRRVDLERRYPASPGRVWRALTEPSEMVTWLGRVQGEPGPSSDFTIWHDDVVRSQHAVLTWEPARLLSLTWDFPDEEESSVSFRISQHGGGVDTVLAIAHQDVLDPVSYAAGWHIHLDYLAAHLSAKDKPFADFWDPYDTLVKAYTAAGMR